MDYFVITRSFGTMENYLFISVCQLVKQFLFFYVKSWDQQNYLVIRGFCYIRPLYNEVLLYYVFKQMGRMGIIHNFYSISVLNSISVLFLCMHILSPYLCAHLTETTANCLWKHSCHSPRFVYISLMTVWELDASILAWKRRLLSCLGQTINTNQDRNVKI